MVPSWSGQDRQATAGNASRLADDAARDIADDRAEAVAGCWIETHQLKSLPTAAGVPADVSDSVPTP